ncbi:MAG: riboflavin kinase [Rikenellaceae bacterium]
MCVIEGVVVEGRQLGRTLGFPTANIELRDERIENGVYCSTILLESGSEYQGVTNIGTNPTVEVMGGAIRRRAESYIFDFEGDIYGQSIKVKLMGKLRDEICFESVEALKSQVLRDIDMAREVAQRE